MLVDTSGRQYVIGAGTAGTQLGGVLTIQGDPSGTPVPVSGSFTTDGYVTTLAPTYVDSTSNFLSLTTRGGLRIDGVYVAGTANATAADVMNSGGYVTTAAPTYTTGQLNPLSLTTGGLLRVDGSGVTQPVSGTVAVSSVSGTVAVTQSTSPWVVSGTVTANAGTGDFNNASVGATGSAAPADTTFMGALTATVAPSYSTALMEPLSLTLQGGLRIDGVAPTGAAGPTDAMYVAGSVTTAAPTYTTGQMSPLSLDTAGNLRTTSTFTNPSVGPTAAAPPADATYMGALVTTAAESGLTTGDMYPLNLTTTGQLRIDGNYPLATAVATAVDMAQVGGVVTTAAPAYTTATINALSLTTRGGLRVDGVYPQATANASAPDIYVTGGYVTTAAPTYTTGQLNPLSLDVNGNLRTTAVTNKAGTSTVAQISVSSSVSTTLLAANSARVAAQIYNNNTQLLYILMGTGAASATNFSILLMSNSYWEVPNDWTGPISALSKTITAPNTMVTEMIA